MNKELAEYIKSARAAAMTDAQIRHELLKVGWQVADIEDELGTIDAKIKKSMNPALKTIIYLLFIILLMGSAAAGFYTLDRWLGWGIIKWNISGQQEQQQSEDILQALQAQMAEMDKVNEDMKKIFECRLDKGSIGKNTTEEIICYSAVLAGASQDLCGRMDAGMSSGQGFSQKEACWAAEAIAKNDNKLCSEKGGRFSTICNAIISAAGGEGLPEEQLLRCETEKDCYEWIISEKGYDESVCAKIVTNLNAKDICYSGAAKTKKDQSVCLNIKDGARRGDCYAIVAAAKGDEALCAEAVKQNKNYNIDNCYASVAASKADLLVCGKIKNSNSKDNCYSSIAAINRDESICSQEASDLKKDACYSLLAAVKKDEAVCEEIKTAKGVCYEELALAKMDESLCIKSGLDICYLYLAELKAKKGLCDKAGSMKTSCYEKVGKQIGNQAPVKDN